MKNIDSAIKTLEMQIKGMENELELYSLTKEEKEKIQNEISEHQTAIKVLKGDFKELLINYHQWQQKDIRETSKMNVRELIDGFIKWYKENQFQQL